MNLGAGGARMEIIINVNNENKPYDYTQMIVGTSSLEL